MSDKKEDFQSFQIGNLTPPRPMGGPPIASTPAPAPSQPAASATPEAMDIAPEDRVFPNIEILIETEALEEIGQKMGATCDQLDEIVNTRSGRAKVEAQKARQAYERTFDLIDHLMQLKQTMLHEQNENSQ